ncbi:DUF488 domain-containing protein [Synechocystis sp. LKSZ1]|uniref:DUF488 domain-containing protein n=1 Tax=Synechocystis sp. LKSZ1 TaxID=3144951 RepID=UPI00336C1126
MKPLFTIGHSNHSPEKFIELLERHGITALADVRSSPYSRYLPHFNRKSLETLLPQADIRYVFLGDQLGARPNNPNCYVDGKALYERIAQTTAFQQGLQRLLKGSQNYRIALMCAEKDPLTCHRAILVCQQLLPFNLEIGHIHSNGELEYHENLEERMLKLHGLQDLDTTMQLSLFSGDTPPLSERAERLHQAYHLQGERIAYVEK